MHSWNPAQGKRVFEDTPKLDSNKPTDALVKLTKTTTTSRKNKLSGRRMVDLDACDN